MNENVCSQIYVLPKSVATFMPCDDWVCLVREDSVEFNETVGLTCIFQNITDLSADDDDDSYQANLHHLLAEEYV